MKRCTYRLEVAYDGTRFPSFAPVPGERSVWTAVRDALISAVPGFSKFAAAGRTDKNVSAVGQIFSFISRDPVELENIRAAVDAAAPDALAVLDVRRVSDSFHAQFTACARRYTYFHPDDGTLDVARLDRMLCALLGRRDFNAYARETPFGKKTDKYLWDARARRIFDPERSAPFIRFDLAGDAFLRRQVRVIVATALREASNPGAGDDILVELAEQRDRRSTALPAPAEGLFLMKVGYDPISKKR